jgi:glycosyltransferase involved in cell wall biosynthesis
VYVVAHNGSQFVGGAERATLKLLLGLRERGHDVRLFFAFDVVGRHAESVGIPAERALLGGDVILPHALRFAAQLRKHDPDALIIGTFKKMLLAGLAARLARVPRVVARIGLETDFPRTRKYNFAIDHFVDAVVLKTGDMRDKYVEKGIPPEKLAVIQAGVVLPPRKHADGELRRSLGIAPDARVIGALARLDVQKRLDRLVEVLPLLDGDVHLVVAGEGVERERLESQAARLGVAERVHLPGMREDVSDVLAALDVYAITSDREGTSNSMLEALAAGVPVVSTPVSGAVEALSGTDDNAPGIVTGFDVGSISTALRAILDSAEKREQMSRAAIVRARTSFSFERMINEWESLLETGHA